MPTFVARPLASFLLLTALSCAGTLAQAQLPAKVGDTPVPSLAPMIKKVSPTVVSIATRGTIRGGNNPLLDDPFFRRFFEDGPRNLPREREFTSAGSGVVVDSKLGYIITNAHVVANATEITITTQDNRRYTAEVVGSDPPSDVAVLKLKDKTNLAAITLGDSSNLEVGDFVVAIGNPFGLQHSVTSGIVSALGRAPQIQEDAFEDFIQTDASINPGNSGGALVNLKGELVGVNSAILSGGGGNIGIGFAIPVNMVKNVMDQLIRFGEVKRGILGVRIFTLTPDLLEAAGAPPNTQGALVSQVDEGSAAEKAGIKINDIITSINGTAVRSGGELRNAIGLLRVGEKIEVGLLRDGKPRKVTALIGEATASTAAAATDIHRGLEGARLSDAPNATGVLVADVERDSPAAQSGIRPNDVIVGVNRSRVNNLRELRTATDQLRAAAQGGNYALVLSVRRNNQTQLLPIR
ncbi:MAG TPA: Do family serine endopeptidase [Steroidobacteraceae bacterium]|nr:Do family serine endopeptidase [Steroidobacteraceae bacterium]